MFHTTVGIGNGSLCRNAGGNGQLFCKVKPALLYTRSASNLAKILHVSPVKNSESDNSYET
jgi:hypothetical protein